MSAWRTARRRSRCWTASICRFEEGEFVCVLGQTGCGKSTLLRLMLGSEQPCDGRILIDGVEHHQPDRTRGYVPQKYSLFPDKTVLDNITFGAGGAASSACSDA